MFHSQSDYARRLTDASWWGPHALHVCRLHGLEEGDVRPGIAGSNPVMLVDGRHAVKFFGPYGEAARSHAIEREVCSLLAGRLPVPALVAQGELFPESDSWPWPYLVTRVVAGVPYLDVEHRVDPEGRREVARFAGRLLRRVHETPVAGPVLRHSRDDFMDFLGRRARECAGDHARWGSLPVHLARQVGSYLPPPRELVGSQGLRLLHADLNADHLLVEQRGDRWVGCGVIDFGDARVGEPLYELAALHLGLFRADKRLLETFLEAYGAEEELRRDLPRRATALALLHEFDVLGPIFRDCPELALVPSLEDLSRRLWDPSAPGPRTPPGSRRPAP